MTQGFSLFVDGLRGPLELSNRSFQVCLLDWVDCRQILELSELVYLAAAIESSVSVEARLAGEVLGKTLDAVSGAAAESYNIQGQLLGSQQIILVQVLQGPFAQGWALVWIVQGAQDVVRLHLKPMRSGGVYQELLSSVFCCRVHLGKAAASTCETMGSKRMRPRIVADATGATLPVSWLLPDRMRRLIQISGRVICVARSAEIDSQNRAKSNRRASLSENLQITGVLPSTKRNNVAVGDC